MFRVLVLNRHSTLIRRYSTLSGSTSGKNTGFSPAPLPKYPNWYFDLEFLLPIHEGKRRISKPRGIWIVILGTLRTTLVLLFGGYHCTTRIEENFDLNGNCYRIATCSVQYCEKSDCCNSDRVTTRGILVAILGGLR